jgi:hypothetical protein
MAQLAEGKLQTDGGAFKSPGMIITALSESLPGDFGHQIEEGFKGFKDAFSKLTTGGGISMAGIGEFFKGLMEKLSDFMNHSSSIKTLGNDGNKLVQDFAQLTGANPRVTEMSPGGAERDLGRAQDLAQTMALNTAAPKPTDPNLAQSGIKMPSGPGGMA